MENDIYIILGMKKRAESEDPKHSFFTVLGIVHGEKEALEKYESFKHKGKPYDGYMIANIMDISITKTTVEFINVEPYDFLYKPVHRTSFFVNET